MTARLSEATSRTGELDQGLADREDMQQGRGRL